MPERKPKSTVIYHRVTPDTKQAFNEMSAQFGMTPSEVLRELVLGFIEGRVTVSPPSHVKEFYNVPGSQD